jgi:hypothetical protein
MSEQNNIQNLLNQISEIVKKYDDLAQLSGENFNVFKVQKNLDKDYVKTNGVLSL